MKVFERILKGDYVTHSIFGFMLSGVAYLLLKRFGILVGVSLPTVFAIYFFSILPDVDTPASIARRWATRLLFIGIFYYSFVGPQLFFIKLLSGLGLLVWFMDWLGVKHRGIVHNPITGLLLAGVLYWLSNDVWVAFFAFIGFLSHLILDPIWTWYERRKTKKTVS